MVAEVVQVGGSEDHSLLCGVCPELMREEGGSSRYGVALGRLHVARAIVEAGYVENLKQAFTRYLYDGGPAYAMGSKPSAEAVVQLISKTGGISALAHPWALKNAVAVVKSLKAAGLHAMEVYRGDGKLDGFSNLADTYDLLKHGGSDFHGKGGHDEADVGSVNLPILALSEFLKMAKEIDGADGGAGTVAAATMWNIVTALLLQI